MTIPDLTGKTAFVTGGSRNLGATIAKTLAAHGAQVAINYHHAKDAAQTLQADLSTEKCPAHIVRGDMASSAQAVVEQALARLNGRIDILVNNAGPFNADPFSELDEAEWDRIININLKAVYLASKVVVPAMREAGWGRIINISAGSAYIRNHGVYGLAKAALNILTEQLALELGPEITVNAIAPGQIKESGPDISAIDPTFVERAIAHSPAGRLVTRQEVANLVVWLCGSETVLLTGHTIPVDAGWRFNRF